MSKYALSLDLDRTIINATRRYDYAKARAKEGSTLFWSIFLDGTKYYLDEPIEPAREFLVEMKRINPDLQLVYLSGRPEKSIGSTRRWLKEHRYPDGLIYHRKSGKTLDYKTKVLLQLQKDGYHVYAHIGDDEDDIQAAKNANVTGIRIEPNSWDSEVIIRTLMDVNEQNLNEGETE